MDNAEYGQGMGSNENQQRQSQPLPPSSPVTSTNPFNPKPTFPASPQPSSYLAHQLIQNLTETVEEQRNEVQNSIGILLKYLQFLSLPNNTKADMDSGQQQHQDSLFTPQDPPASAPPEEEMDAFSQTAGFEDGDEELRAILQEMLDSGMYVPHEGNQEEDGMG